MEKIKLQVHGRRYLADTVTPVHLYLKLRDHFEESALLESTDFRSIENCHSFIGLGNLASGTVTQNTLHLILPDQSQKDIPLKHPHDLSKGLADFMNYFDIIHHSPYRVLNGMFGHFNFDSVRFFDTVKLDPTKKSMDLPDARFSVYRFVIAIDHYKDEMYILENNLSPESDDIDRIESLILNEQAGTYRFKREGQETSTLTDQAYRDLVTKGKEHCQKGDVFQVVFARRFRQAFSGDEFNVYRALRFVNPSPYLFYFDLGNYKIFGSSPESQLVINKGIASVNPIAGTYKRSGDDELDRQRAKELALDPKENAEHIMLVDLARNDLGRHSEKVEVKVLKEIQYFSHVIHLVSKVEGRLEKNSNIYEVFGDTFPAGTLSGAPKYRAIELIDQFEPEHRNFYGGSIGFVSFEGALNHAITIRSFLSKDNELHYQAGAGIVATSVEENELQEVNNKLGALRKALAEAEHIK